MTRASIREQTTGFRPIRICLDARFDGGGSGGIEQVVIGLASGLSKLTDGNEEYFFLTKAGADDWLAPYLRGRCKALPTATSGLAKMRSWAGSRLPSLKAVWHTTKRQVLGNRSAQLPGANSEIENAAIDVMHFTTQNGFVTDIPSIYQPHDLQHLHFPEFFPAHVRSSRERLYRTFCDQAQMVAVMTDYGKNDVIRRYGLSEQKVQVIPWAPILAEYHPPGPRECAAVKQARDLPAAFALYPAQTWPHKNHINLLKALAVLRDTHSVTIPLVCSGRLNEHFSDIKRHIKRLGLRDQVRFLGFVSTTDIQCLYDLCRCVVFPSKFEGCGMPVLEAFFAGAPVVCSNIGSLKEQTGDAAVLFDPDNVDEIARSLLELWTNSALQKSLRERGKEKAALLSWEKTARIFRAHYRRLAQRGGTCEDASLLRTRRV